MKLLLATISIQSFQAKILLEDTKNGKVLAYKFKDKYFDCGSVDGFVKAMNYFYEKSRT